MVEPLTVEQQILQKMIEEGRRLHALGFSYKEVAAGIEELRDKLVQAHVNTPTNTKED